MSERDEAGPTDIQAIRAELTEIAQAYNAAGMAILNALHPGGYVSFGKMPDALRPLEHAQDLLGRFAVLGKARRQTGDESA